MNNSIQNSYDRRQGLPCAFALHNPFKLRRLAVAMALMLTVLVGALGHVPLALAEEAVAVEVAVVNINTADASSLAETLKGVGQSRAEAIVRYREAYGPFASVDELAEVKGIGQSTLDMNRTRITLE